MMHPHLSFLKPPCFIHNHRFLRLPGYPFEPGNLFEIAEAFQAPFADARASKWWTFTDPVTFLTRSFESQGSVRTKLPSLAKRFLGKPQLSNSAYSFSKPSSLSCVTCITTIEAKQLPPPEDLNADSMLPPDQEESPNPDTEFSAYLKFPTIPVAGTPAGWLSRSQLITAKMALQYDADSSCDEATSSLGDSTYDFVDDRSTMTDDEEGDRMTESTSSDSFEADRPVVIATQQHTPATTRVDYTDDAQLHDIAFNMNTPTYSTGEHDVFDSQEAPVKKESLAEDTDETIEFDEPSVINLNTSRFTEVSHTLEVIEEPHQVKGDLYNAIKGLPRRRILVTVRQTMTSRSIELQGKPYKVLVAGDASMKEPIIKKIAAALAANLGSLSPDSDDARPAKYNIVPVSGFGDSGHPDVVLIDSSGLELSVDDCTAAGYSRCQDGKDSLSLRMADNSHVQSWWIGSKYELSNEWKLPDLAIFCASEDESALSKQTRCLARSFMNRYAVPSIVIQRQATWGKHTDMAALTTLDYLTPHLCLESQQPNGYSPLSNKRYPIDLATFLNINAGQMNRNLACLATSKRSSEPRADTLSKHRMFGRTFWHSNARKAFREMPTYVSQERIASILPLLAFVLLSVTPLMLWGFLGFPVTSAKPGASSMDAFTAPRTNSSAVMVTTQPSLVSTFAPAASSTAPVSSPIPSPKPLSSNTDIASLLLDAYDLGRLRPDKSDEFIVQVLGDCHIVVNTPRLFRRSKKLPSLLFNVSRHETSIEYTLSTIGDGVYALQVPHEEAYGMLNLSMTIQSNKIEQKKFEVDFGSSWLQVAAWRRATRAVSGAVQKDLSIVQTGLSVAYNHSIAEFSTIVRQTKNMLAARRKAEYAMLAAHLKRGAHTKDLVLAQTKDLSKNVSHRLYVGQRQVVQQVQSLTKAVTRSVTIYTRDSIRSFSPHVHHLAQSVKHLKVQDHDHAGERLKSAQKKALRAWWTIVGVSKTSRLPKQKRLFACEGEL